VGPQLAPPALRAQPPRRPDATFAEVVATGHTLEWLALLPDELPCDRAMVARACDYLLVQLLEAGPSALGETYNAYTHAGAALKVWAPSAWQSLQQSWQAGPSAVTPKEVGS
jgi:hypothetical protein